MVAGRSAAGFTAVPVTEMLMLSAPPTFIIWLIVPVSGATLECTGFAGTDFVEAAVLLWLGEVDVLPPPP